VRDSSEMNGNVADEALLCEDMVGGGGGMKPTDEKSNGYVDRGDFIYTHYCSLDIISVMVHLPLHHRGKRGEVNVLAIYCLLAASSDKSECM
jgi:hypothetical protein